MLHSEIVKVIRNNCKTISKEMGKEWVSNVAYWIIEEGLMLNINPSINYIVDYTKLIHFHHKNPDAKPVLPTYSSY